MTRTAVYRLLLLPLAAFTAHVAAGFDAVSIHCHRGVLNDTLAGVSESRLAMWALTAATAALLLLAARTAMRLWRRAESPGEDPTGGHAMVFSLSAATCALAMLYLVWSLVLTASGNGCR